jgi:hypothetical protein
MIVSRALRRLADRQDVVMGFVQCRTYQVVHRGVDDDEVLRLARLHIDDAGHEDAGIADDHPPRLEHQRAAEIMRHPA